MDKMRTIRAFRMACGATVFRRNIRAMNKNASQSRKKKKIHPATKDSGIRNARIPNESGPDRAIYSMWMADQITPSVAADMVLYFNITDSGASSPLRFHQASAAYVKSFAERWG